MTKDGAPLTWHDMSKFLDLMAKDFTPEGRRERIQNDKRRLMESMQNWGWSDKEISEVIAAII